jgi:hypothetical protein
MAIPQLLDSIIRSGPSARLKRHGFSQKGRAFFIYRGEVFQFVHFFPSQWSRADVAVFTLSVGVTIRYWHRDPRPPEQMITDILPLVGRRFGPDLDHPVGQFWSAHSIEPAASQVIERLETHALPWLSEYATETSLAGYLRDCKTGIPLVNLCALARIMARTGRHDQVADVMARAQAELNHLKTETRMDQWEPCRSMVVATEEWIKREREDSKRSGCPPGG